ncbi:MAG: DUF971 domain-containing protein [Gammaproteobacteria bacterium]|nr:DUF971 domain-containing protein [Gammaproteobacteria bacterium]MBU2056536.1 DUF971 domain-containing protein [Gammaproteobacteria bacterium]MBU2174201.1 DUF971 domain-containing protein [Gammaproteobacteria bacterium]MBU2248748.1 DUF971 domain-containing protein [Gammaproteobacteria bacterium]MBU2346500.1 DUF971 domain-containing protein [Gammaproteobacteria bacterium]
MTAQTSASFTAAKTSLVSVLHYHRLSKVLDVQFSDEQRFSFSAEFLRVFSPSAEVRGHGKPQLVSHKKDVAIHQIVPVGLYAVKLVFDDAHQTGLYSWAYLAKLATEQDELWKDYLLRLKQANSNRDSQLSIKQVF